MTDLEQSNRELREALEKARETIWQYRDDIRRPVTAVDSKQRRYEHIEAVLIKINAAISSDQSVLKTKPEAPFVWPID